MAIHIKTAGTPLEKLWLESPCAVLYDFANKMPGEDIVLHLSGAPFYIFQNSQSAQHIWRGNPENYQKYFGTYDTFFGKSRLTTDGELWRSLKKYSQPFITNTKPADIIEATVKYFDIAIVGILEDSGVSNRITIDDAFDLAAASTVCETTLGFPLEAWGAGAIDELRAILKYAAVVNWRKLDESSKSDTKLVADAVHAKESLARRLAKLSSQYTESGTNTDLFAILLEASNKDVDLMGEVCTLLFAGFETTASGLGWAAYLLATMPELQEKLCSQMQTLPSDRAPTIKELTALTDLQSFINEALRMFPPIPLLGRKAVDDDVINGTEVKAGELAFISIIGLHHDANYYSRPSNFTIARFPEGKPRTKNIENFMPFADGKRVCVGARFANIEMLAALSTILRSVKLSLPETTPLLFNWEASLRRKDGHLLEVVSRN